MIIAIRAGVKFHVRFGGNISILKQYRVHLVEYFYFFKQIHSTDRAIFLVHFCELFVDAVLSWRNGCNKICTNGKQMVFLQYESSCEFVTWKMISHDSCKQGRCEVSCPIWRQLYQTETI